MAPKVRPRGRPKKGEGVTPQERLQAFVKSAERKVKVNAKLGRPSSLDARLYTIIVNLVAQGKTYEEIGDVIGISKSTIAWWVTTNANLKHDINRARTLADDMVEEALFKTAVGYTHEEEKVFCSMGEILTHKTRKHYPPNVDACRFWLTNRKSNIWTSKEKIATDSNVTVQLAYNPDSRLVETNNGREEIPEQQPQSDETLGIEPGEGGTEGSL